MEGRKEGNLIVMEEDKVKMNINVRLTLRAILSHEYKCANTEYMDISKS